MSNCNGIKILDRQDEITKKSLFKRKHIPNKQRHSDKRDLVWIHAKLFGTRDLFHGRSFFHGPGACVGVGVGQLARGDLGMFKDIILILQFILIRSALPQSIKH